MSSYGTLGGKSGSSDCRQIAVFECTGFYLRPTRPLTWPCFYLPFDWCQNPRRIWPHIRASMSLTAWSFWPHGPASHRGNKRPHSLQFPFPPCLPRYFARQPGVPGSIRGILSTCSCHAVVGDPDLMLSAILSALLYRSPH